MLAFSLPACTGTRDDLSDAEFHGEDSLSGSQEHLSRAVRMVEHVEDYNEKMAAAQVLTQLGQWIEDQPPVDAWTADPLTSTLPQRYAKYVQGPLLSRMSYVPHDFLVLREAIWMRNIARWQTQDIGDDLTKATRLFDWTVRNVQLKPTHWDATFPSDDAAEKAADKKDNQSEAKLLPPPGAEMPPWRALLLGHGDALTRAQIFVLLARQQGIDVVMLGLKRDGTQEPRTWAAGAVIGEEIYLFEPELGLPFAGPDGQGVCTLSQLRADPSLLRQFDVDGDQPYHVTEKDLDNLVALIDAAPPYLSQRMMLLQRNLAGDQKVVLTTAPSKLARDLRKMSLSDVRLWTAPYRVFEWERVLYKHPQELAAHDQKIAVYYSIFPLLRARLLHFRGELDNPDVGVYGAKHYYMRCRPSEREIATEAGRLDAMVASLPDIPPEQQPEFVAQQPPENRQALASAFMLASLSDAARKNYIDKMAAVAHAAKAEATFWLGMIAMEQGQGGVAANYFDEPATPAEAAADSRWTDAARYNLARVYEAGGQTEEAIALYEADDSPQRRGNLVRAKRLQK